MIAADWSMFGLGALVGLIAGAVFFAGLALGLRLALRSTRTTSVLLLSSALRIAALLGAGWLVAQHGATALAGFALAFVAMRFASVAIARRPVELKDA
ncbi:ATP synthase subunit AtpR [Myxococcota bacterium]|nr:ATP synthase subunit AtpR [Myxococcota bacterium]MCZ7619902.1 ATP synthase subunit AtpR [Myxococcota bacterium]